MTSPAPDPFSLPDRLEALGGRLLGALPPGVQRALARRPPRAADGDTLDPAIALLLAVRDRLGGSELPGGGDGTAEDVAAARAQLRRDAVLHMGPRTPVGAVHDLEVTGAAGPLGARHYAPAATEPQPAPLLVYLHGGGWTVGDIETHDETCRLLCAHAGVHVVSVDYRLAPEHPFPAGLEDACAALRWAHEQAAALGADPARVALGGDSAGGNLTAAAARLAARSATDAAPALQVLIYPATDLSRRHPSSDPFGEGLFLTNAQRDWYEARYLAGDADPADPRVSPLLADDLDGLPPAIVMTAAFDPLRDEGEAYAHALRAAGTPVVLRRAPGLVHGFAGMTAISRGARAATLELAGMVRAALALG